MDPGSSGDKFEFANIKQENADYVYGMPAHQRKRRSYGKEQSDYQDFRYEQSDYSSSNVDGIHRVYPEDQRSEADKMRLGIQMSTFIPGSLSDSIAPSNSPKTVISEKLNKRPRGSSHHSKSAKNRNGLQDAVMAQSSPAAHASKVAICVLISIIVGCGAGAGIGFGVYSIISDNSAATSGNAGEIGSGNSSTTYKSTNSVVQSSAREIPSSNSGSPSSTTTAREVVKSKKKWCS